MRNNNTMYYLAVVLLSVLAVWPLLYYAETAITTLYRCIHAGGGTFCEDRWIGFLLKELFLIPGIFLLFRWYRRMPPRESVRVSLMVAGGVYMVFVLLYGYLPETWQYHAAVNRWVYVTALPVSEIELLFIILSAGVLSVPERILRHINGHVVTVGVILFAFLAVAFILSAHYRIARLITWLSMYEGHIRSLSLSWSLAAGLMVSLLSAVLACRFVYVGTKVQEISERHLLYGVGLFMSIFSLLVVPVLEVGYTSGVLFPFFTFGGSSLLLFAMILGLGLSVLHKQEQEGGRDV